MLPKDLTRTQRRWVYAGGGVVAVGLGALAWRHLGLSQGSKVLPLGTKVPRGLRNGQLEQSPDVVEFRKGAAERQLVQLADYELVWAPQPTERQIAAQQIELVLQPKPGGGAAQWLATAATLGWDVGFGANGNILIQRRNDARAPTMQFGGLRGDDGTPLDVLFIKGADVYQPLPPLPSGVQPSYVYTMPGVPLPPKPPVFLEQHDELRPGYQINWAMLKELGPKITFPALTDEVIARYQTVPPWVARTGWRPAIFNDEKFFDSRYTLPQNQKDMLYAPAGDPSDRGYLINTPRDGMSRYQAMKKKVDLLAPAMGDRTWTIIQAMAAVGAKMSGDAGALMDERLAEIRHFYGQLMRDAGSAAGGWGKVFGEIAGWLFENFLRGAGDDKARLNTQSALEQAGRFFQMTLELGLPPNIHVFTYDFFAGLDGSPWKYTETLNEITKRADTIALLQRQNLLSMLALPKAARDVISMWWVAAVAQLGRDAHARAAFAALMAGKPGAYGMACDEQVYLVGYTMARHYKLDPAILIPALWDAALGWSAWPGIMASPWGMAMNPELSNTMPQKTPDGGMVYTARSTPQLLQALWDYDPPFEAAFDDPGPGVEGSRYFKDVWGRVYPGVQVGAVFASADNSEAEGAHPPRGPLKLPRTITNGVAINWFDLAWRAFQIAEKRKLDWRVGGAFR